MLNIENQRFGYLRAVWPAGRQLHGSQVKTIWLCICDCGKTRLVAVGNLTGEHTRSCGCKGKESRKDITNRVFGRLTARWPEGKNDHSTVWLCSCECGQLTHTPIARLLSGTTRSCGCLASESRETRCLKHGHDRGGKRSPEYRAYCRAKNDCTNPNTEQWDYYGGRGIKFLLPPFPEFFSFLGPRPTPQHSLDRFPDFNGHYELTNIRWATKKEQANNRRKAKPRRKINAS